jgi:sugar-specific transcriptional regulator TrmB
MEYSNVDTNLLKQIGFSESESQTYLALLRLRNAHAGKISKSSQLNRTTTYDALNRLIEKGLVTQAITNNRRTFQPIHPSQILERVKNMEETAKEIIPELTKLYDSSEKPVEETVVYCGRKGIKHILFDILKCKEYVGMGFSRYFLENMKHDFISFQKRKKELKTKARVILAESARDTEEVKIGFSNVKYIPDEYASITTSFAYGNQVAYIIWMQTPIATVITSEIVAQSYRNNFELMWKVAKP